MKKTAKSLLDIYKMLYDHFGPQNWWPAANNFEMIIGAILTQNVTWKNVEKALNNLKAQNLLCPKRLAEADFAVVEKAIYSTRYYKQKAMKIFAFLEFLRVEYQGDLLKMLEEKEDKLRPALLGIRGIGPETADSILLYAGQKPVFVIDAYTRRIFSRLGLTSPDAAYQELQGFFMDNLSRDVSLYNEYHALIVAAGNRYCLQKPNCTACPLNTACRKRL